jgi:hypothetical protein
MRCVRFAWVLRNEWVWAADVALGRKSSDGNVRVESVYDTPYSVSVELPSQRNRDSCLSCAWIAVKAGGELKRTYSK